ncbi:MAG TPA: GNAT family N-acetyltransferase [Actinomycetota bacterium]|nr:GNAT family N-acetyltransferase [Actinomycetota bacterium]
MTSQPAIPGLTVRDQATGSGAVCRKILDALPEWFGIPEANADYVAFADAAPSVIASLEGEDVGLLTLQLHSPYAAEVHLMAVLPEHHRKGIGRTILQHAELRLAERSVEYLQVKTLSEKRPDPNYDKTRLFYLAQGFRPLEEFPTLWDPANPALQLIKALPRPSTTRL